MRRLLRFLSRISFRLLAFNLLLVFIPVAGVFFLGTFESRLELEQQQSLVDQSRLLASILAQSPEGSLQTAAQRIVAATAGMPANHDRRIRVVDAAGRVVADSSTGARRQPVEGIRHNWLYRAGKFVTAPVAYFLRLREPKLELADTYERAAVLRGGEIIAAGRGKVATTKRISAGRQRSVTLYAAAPVVKAGDVAGAVLVSSSTSAILADLYAVRLSMFRIFAVSVVFAIVLSLWIAATIVGPLRTLRVEAGAILDKRGRLRGTFRGSKRRDEIGDLSRALERLTRRLESHVKFIESFAADVSHEFKNPLASIRSATEMLAEVDDLSEKKRFLRIAEHEIARMESLLSGVREITQIDARLDAEARSRVALDELASQLVDGFRMRGSRGVTLELRSDGKARPVFANRERVAQSLENLLDNAVSFSPAGGNVVVDVGSDRSTTTVIVSDEGPGIAPENLGRIFDRFFTVRPDAAARDRHTGLGLSIVKAIAEGYGGTITASNRTDRSGARFELRLPS